MSDDIRTVTDIATLEADVANGQGTIRLNELFHNQALLWQLDVMTDWITQLTTLYNEINEDWADELAKEAGAGKPVAINPEDPVPAFDQEKMQ